MKLAPFITLLKNFLKNIKILIKYDAHKSLIEISLWGCSRSNPDTKWNFPILSPKLACLVRVYLRYLVQWNSRDPNDVQISGFGNPGLPSSISRKWIGWYLENFIVKKVRYPPQKSKLLCHQTQISEMPRERLLYVINNSQQVVILVNKKAKMSLLSPPRCSSKISFFFFYIFILYIIANPLVMQWWGTSSMKVIGDQYMFATLMIRGLG